MLRSLKEGCRINKTPLPSKEAFLKRVVLLILTVDYLLLLLLNENRGSFLFWSVPAFIGNYCPFFERKKITYSFANPSILLSGESLCFCIFPFFRIPSFPYPPVFWDPGCKARKRAFYCFWSVRAGLSWVRSSKSAAFLAWDKGSKLLKNKYPIPAFKVSPTFPVTSKTEYLHSFREGRGIEIPT